jgi:hypothetical protein
MVRFVPGGGGPMGLYVSACIVGGLAFVLLVIVMRGLLESAIACAGREVVGGPRGARDA